MKTSSPKTKNLAREMAYIVIGTVVSIVSLFAFLLIAFNIQSLQLIDSWGEQFFYSIRSTLLTSVMKQATYLGHELLLLFLLILLGVLIIKKHAQDAKLFIIIFWVGFIANILLKVFFARARPELNPLLYEPLHSFPSGHTMNATIFYCALVLYAHKFLPGKLSTLLTVLIAGFIIFLIGVSRVYLGVHFLTDVLAGFFAGLWWIATASLLQKSLKKFPWSRRRT